MARTKQKFSFQALITNANTKQGSAGVELIPCKLQILSISSDQTTPNLKWNNYIQILTNQLYTMNVDKLTTDSTWNIDWYKASDKTNIVNTIDFETSSAPTAVEVPSNVSEIVGNEQKFLLYCHTPQVIEDLIQYHSGTTPVGNFQVKMKVQLVDEAGIYADSDPVEIVATITSGTVGDKPS